MATNSTSVRPRFGDVLRWRNEGADRTGDGQLAMCIRAFHSGHGFAGLILRPSDKSYVYRAGIIVGESGASNLGPIGIGNRHWEIVSDGD
jgi:hypothetical protein